MTHKTPKNPLKYACEKCDFKCCNNKDFKRHLATNKPKMMTNDYTKVPENPKAYIQLLTIFVTITCNKNNLSN